MAANTLKEFLVAIGFKVDEVQLKKFNDRVEQLTSKIAAIAEEATLTATAVSASVTKMASDMERLYFASQRTGASATSLRAFDIAAQAAGLSVEEARASVEGLASTLRQPGMTQVLQGFGVKVDKDSTKTMFNLVEQLKKMGGPGTAGYAQATAIAGMFGINERELFQLETNLDESKKQYAASLAKQQQMKKSGVDLDKFAADSHKFMEHLRETMQGFDTLAYMFTGRLLPIGEKVLGWVDKLSTALMGLDEKTHGLSTIVGGIISVAVGAKAVLGMLGRLFSFGGKAAAAGEAAEGAAVGAEAVEGVGAAAAGGEAVAGGLAIGAGGWIVLAAAAVAAAIAYIVSHPEQVGKAVAAVSEWAGKARDWTKKAAGDAWDWTKKEVKALPSQVSNEVKALPSQLKAAGQKLQQWGGQAQASMSAFGNDWMEKYRTGKDLGGLDPDVVNRIARSEGYRDKKYWDNGHWSIGFGHQIQNNEGNLLNSQLTTEQARNMLVKDIASVYTQVKKMVHTVLNPQQMSSLVDFAFNVGTGKLASSSLLKDINAGNLDAASREFLRWDKEQKTPGVYTVNAGLHARRQDEADRFAGHHVELSQTATIVVQGGNSQEVAAKVRDAQAGLSNDLLRNTVSALDNGRPTQQ